MGKLIKTALVFTGGMTVGGYCVINVALKSQTFTAALKDAIANKAVEAIYGSEVKRNKRKVSYYDIYRRPRNTNHVAECYEDIIFKRRGDADFVLYQMETAIDRYGFVSVLDLYDLAGVNCHINTANKHGWTDLSTGKVVRNKDGYILELPRTVQIS